MNSFQNAYLAVLARPTIMRPRTPYSEIRTSCYPHTRRQFHGVIASSVDRKSMRVYYWGKRWTSVFPSKAPTVNMSSSYSPTSNATSSAEGPSESDPLLSMGRGGQTSSDKGAGGFIGDNQVGVDDDYNAPHSEARRRAEMRLLRKLDFRLLPTVAVIFIMNYIDVSRASPLPSNIRHIPPTFSA